MILAVYEGSAPLRVPVIILLLVFTLDPAESFQSPADGFRFCTERKAGFLSNTCFVSGGRGE